MFILIYNLSFNSQIINLRSYEFFVYLKLDFTNFFKIQPFFNF